jgi:hypothetical protein
MVQDVRLGFVEVVVVVVATLELKEDHSGGTKSERRPRTIILRGPGRPFKYIG